MTTRARMAEKTAVDTFGIALPSGWTRIPLEDGLFEDHLRNQRRLLREEVTLSRTAERQYELIMRQLRNDCVQSNVRLLGVLLAPYGGRPSDDDEAAGEPSSGSGNESGNESESENEIESDSEGESELLAVGCTLSLLDQAELGVDVPLTVNTLVSAMSRQVATERDGVRIVTLENPDVVRLPAGEAVRVRRSHRYRSGPEDGKEVAIYVHHLLIPFGGGGREALVATFCTPSIGHLDPLTRLFDEIADTIRLFGADDDDTDPLASGPHPDPDYEAAPGSTADPGAVR